MSDTTPRLGLPWLMPAQAQKHVTVNQALGRLDAITAAAAQSRSVDAQPADPAEGEAYILPAAPSGADWADFFENDLVSFQDGAWMRVAARAGLTAFVADEGALVMFDGSAWVPMTDAIASLDNLQSLGVGAAPDAANPFVAKLNAALWTARYAGEGGSGDLRYTLNKEGPQDTLSLLFQSGWSGRAEIGLTGSDDLSVKVSGDGAGWTEALRVARGTGRVTIARAAISAERLNGGPLAGFRNLIVNGCHRIWQRGTSVTVDTPGYTWGYGPDRVQGVKTGPAPGSLTISRVALSGDEGIEANPRFAARFDPRALVNASFHRPTWKLGQEALWLTAARRCIFSFWARASETHAYSVFSLRDAGAGGSGGGATQHGAVTLDPDWRRHEVVMDMDDLSGFTAGDGYFLDLFLQRSASSFTETVDFANMQLEIAESGQTAASPFEYRDEAVELALCRRYFERKTVRAQNGARHVPLAPKRAAPSVAVSAGTAAHVTPDGFELTHSAAADCVVEASAEL